MPDTTAKLLEVWRAAERASAAAREAAEAAIRTAETAENLAGWARKAANDAGASLEAADEAQSIAHGAYVDRQEQQREREGVRMAGRNGKAAQRAP